jgi:hypothetical protein
MKSKSSNTTINIISFIGTITIVLKKERRTYQNEFDNKQMKKNLAKLKITITHGKTYVCRNINL